MMRCMLTFLLVCSLAFLDVSSAVGTIIGSFTAPPTSFYAPQGGTAFYGQPLGPPGSASGGLATSITTTAVPSGAGEVPLPPPVFGSPAVEVLFLTDTTGSMGSIGTGGLAALQSAIAFSGGLMTSYETANPGITFSWAVADYHDFIGTDPYVTPPYAVQSTFGTAAAAEAAVAAYTDPAITVGGGLAGQEPEQQFSAMVELAEGWESVLGGSAQGAAERVIVWTGDSAANEGAVDYGGSGTFTYPTLFNTTAALRDAGISVWGMNVGASAAGIDTANGLALNQASEIMEGTGGVLTNSVAALSSSAFFGTITGSLDTATGEMNNIVVRADPSTLGAWSVDYFERNTNYPLDATYPFNFTYSPTAPPIPGYVPFGSDGTKPFGFPGPWGAFLGTPSFIDYWGLQITAPNFPNSQLATFELRVDGVLVSTVDILLTNELSGVVPEPSTLLTSAGLLALFPAFRRRRRRIG